jgi:hypothetical protein
MLHFSNKKQPCFFTKLFLYSYFALSNVSFTAACIEAISASANAWSFALME